MTGLKTIATLGAPTGLTVHITTPLNDFEDQKPRIFINVPNFVLVILLAMETLTLTTPEPILPVQSALEVRVPMINATYNDKSLYDRIYVDLPPNQFLQFHKFSRIIVLLRAILNSGTVTVFQFALPFSKPRVSPLSHALIHAQSERVLIFNQDKSKWIVEN